MGILSFPGVLRQGRREEGPRRGEEGHQAENDHNRYVAINLEHFCMCISASLRFPPEKTCKGGGGEVPLLHDSPLNFQPAQVKLSTAGLKTRSSRASFSHTHNWSAISFEISTLPFFPGKRRLDEMYHTPAERSDFYSMADLVRQPVLFTPTGDPDKAAVDFGTELPSFYASRYEGFFSRLQHFLWEKLQNRRKYKKLTYRYFVSFSDLPLRTLLLAPALCPPS